MSGYDLNEITNEHRYPTFHYRVGSFVMGFGGVVASMTRNVVLKLPAAAATPRHILYGAIGALIGHKLVDIRNNHLRDQQIVYEDYMKLHPEEFKEPEIKLKYKDVLRDWYPTR